MNDRLYRSRDDRVVGGVCAGLAERLDLDPSIVRVGWVFLTILTGGVFFVLYVVMLIVVPEEPYGEPAYSGAPQPGAIPGWSSPQPGTGWTPPAGPRPGDSAGWTTAATSGPPDAVPGWTPPGTPGESVAPTAGAGPDALPADATGTPATAFVATPTPSPTPGWTAPPPMSRAEARAVRRAARQERRRNADPTVGLIFGAILVLVGIYFLAEQYIPSLDLGRFWPVIVIGIGVLLVGRAFYRPRPDA